LSKPKFTQGTGAYLFQWEEEAISIRIDRLYEDSKFNISCEVTILQGAGSHLHQARLNLTSTQARKSLAKVLQEREEHIDWYSLLEIACVRTLEAHRVGEPVYRLDEMKATDRVKWRLEPLLVEGYPNLIYGPGGIGKSLLATYFSLLIGLPYKQHNLNPEPGNVLILDWEFSGEETQERADRLLSGMTGLTGAPIYYRFCWRPFADDIEEIRRTCMEKTIQMVVIDSAGPACAGQPESAEATLRFFTAFRALHGITGLVIAHEAKNAAEKSPFGSVYWTNMARNVYKMQKDQDMESNKLNISLVHKKANTGRLQRPMALQFKFNTDGPITIATTDINQNPELSKGLPIKYQISQVLLNGALGPEEIADTIDKKVDSVRVTLSRSPMFVALGNGRWGLRAKENTNAAG